MGVITQGKAQAIAIEMVNSNFDHVKALLAMGYKQSTITCKGKKIVNNPLVVANINKLQQRATLSAAVCIESVLADINQAKAIAIKNSDVQGILAATNQLGRYLAMFTDKQIVDAPQQHQQSRPDAIDRSVKRLLAIEYQDAKQVESTSKPHLIDNKGVSNEL